jgi:hypothetical protein
MRPDLDQRKLVPHPFDCAASTAFKMNPERFFIRMVTYRGWDAIKPESLLLVWIE